MSAESITWLTIAEAANYLKITRATLYRWAKNGRIAIFKFGPGIARVRKSDLAALASPLGIEPAKFREMDGWARLGLSTFWRDWNNDKDAVYNNWREIYGVRER